MAEININNYEAYLLDFIEGNIQTTDAHKLRDFFICHPEIDADVFPIEDVCLTSNKTEYPHKLKLKRSERISEMSLQDELLIGLLENDLSVEDKNYITDKIASNPFIAQEYEMYQKTIIQETSNLKFQNKISLRKSIVFSRIDIRNLSVAAVLVGLLFSIVFVINNQNLDPTFPSDKLTNAIIPVTIDNRDDVEEELLSEPMRNIQIEDENDLALHIPDKIERSSIPSNTVVSKVAQLYTPIHIDRMNSLTLNQIMNDVDLNRITDLEYDQIDWSGLKLTYVKTTNFEGGLLSDITEQLNQFNKEVEESLGNKSAITVLRETRLEQKGKFLNPIKFLRNVKNEFLSTSIEDI